jgi:hypothetical protein
MSDFSESSCEKQAEVPKRGKNGRFLRGVSGNPGGKPKGRRSHVHQAIDKLLADNAEDVVERIIRAAKAGDAGAMRLVLDRLQPPRRSRPLQLEGFPRIVTLADCDVAMSAVLKAVTEGLIDLDQATALTDLVETKRRTLETVQLEARLAALEAREVSGPVLEHGPASALPSLFEEDEL